MTAAKDEADDLKQVALYTDGGCSPNPGPGGYGVVLIYGKHRRELSGGYRLSTNNRMEITAAIMGLRALKEPCRVTVHADSKYVCDAIGLGWARKWRENGWYRGKPKNEKNRALNSDLWQQLLDLCDYHEVTFKWVRGHSGNRENERCDELCGVGRAGKLLIDEGYKAENGGS